jgi:transposase
MRGITRSYRIRTYPNGAQRRLRDRWFGAYRWLWNTALEIRTEAYRQRGEPALSRRRDRMETRNLKFAETRGSQACRIAAER